MNFAFLQTLKLKSAVYLSLDPPGQMLREFLKEQKIELKQMTGGEKTNAGQRISEQLVLGALRVLLHPDSYPLIVMCNLGRHRTGTVIGCLRRVQTWCLSSIIDEFRRFAGSNSSPMHEQFIELFDPELVELPADVERLPFRLGVALQGELKVRDAERRRHARGAEIPAAARFPSLS
jgi:tyrosine-protein phosphatase OCA1